MTTKDLKDKAINIKGKEYVQVKDRVLFFNENYVNGCIKTELITEPSSNRIIIKATVLPDIDKPDRTFCDYAQEEIGGSGVNATSALENCSTSAIGRALACMGIGVLDSIASVDEIVKADNRQAAIQSSFGKCPKCQAPNAKSQSTGKIFCSKKCWLSPTPSQEAPPPEEYPLDDRPF